MKESATASYIRLFAAQIGIDLWRNNSGAFVDQTGRMVRYGLCNDSKKLSDRVKSSDYIGITPVTITPDMVGRTIGVFTAIETKDSEWKFLQSDKRSLAQAAFHDIVRRAGGFAGFARSIEEFKKIVGK